MLGRVRPSSSSLECLEMEREPSKIVKHDILSIYEATLMKLRQGAQRGLDSFSEQAMKIEVDCNSASNSPHETVTTIDTNSSPCSVASSSSECWPMSSSRERQNKMVSVTYMFDRYKSSQRAPRSPQEAVMAESDCSSSFSSLSPRTSD